MHGLVHFIHGKESGPSGGKIAALATVARSRQWNVASLDYSHTMHPTVRLTLLLRACADVRTALLRVDRTWVAGSRPKPRGASTRAACSYSCQPSSFQLSRRKIHTCWGNV